MPRNTTFTDSIRKQLHALGIKITETQNKLDHMIREHNRFQGLIDSIEVEQERDGHLAEIEHEARAA